MERTIVLERQTVAYALRPHARARRLRLTVYPGGRLVVTLPSRMAVERAEGFIRAKAAWILDTLARLRDVPDVPCPVSRRRAFLANRDAALALVRDRLAHFNAAYGFAYGRITIKDLKSRWGSCSRAGNLSFSHRIVDLPAPLADYLVIHELCHLGAFDHSLRFWSLVARFAPDYRERRRALRAYRL